MVKRATSYVGGNVYLREGRRASTWYLRWRDRNGEHRKALGPNWTEKGKPPLRVDGGQKPPSPTL